MKKAIALLAAALLTLLCSCADVSHAEVDLGSSQLYSSEELADAADAVKREFLGLSGCTLYSLKYAGDERSTNELEYCREIADNPAFADCIVFTSSFHTSADEIGGFEPNAVINGFDWTCAREKGGGWVVVSYGFC